MRAPFQILAIPYRRTDSVVQFCVFHRADHDQWQFISGGGEDNETPLQAAEREIFEESGLRAEGLVQLQSICCIPTDIFPQKYLANWPGDLYVVPEYSFAFPCGDEIHLSDEHTECVWLNYDQALERLKWDSNRTALYELRCRLQGSRYVSRKGG